MKWKGRRQSSNLDDRRGMSTKGKVAAGGGLIAVVVILLQLFGGETGQQIAPIVEQINNSRTTTTQTSQRELTAQEQEMGAFMGTVLADTEDIWNQLFRQNNLGDYNEPQMVLFTDVVTTRCGKASSASGPFYCPGDQKVYMDLAFFQELKSRFGAKGGDFAIAYVTAHEIGHHVQTLLGTSRQADFYAGLWAHYNKQYLDEGDIEEALSAAQSVGDDAIQKRTRGYVQPDSFTHGTSRQRMEWFMKGYRSGDMSQHDTFQAILN
jgi:predicted metalloprotease